MMRSCASLIALIALSQFAAAQVTDVPVPAPSPLPTAAPCPYDGNLEVLYPPLLDEGNTHLVFNDELTDFEVTILVPNQYTEAAFSFDGASDSSGGFNSSNLGANIYWSVDDTSDPCNTIYVAMIPWDFFRTSLGGVAEERYSDVVYYRTEILIDVQRPLVLNPETLLLEEPELLQQQLTRTVRTRIPFEVAFDLQIDLSATANVTSDHLRVAAAVILSSIDTVDPAYLPRAKAAIELVTVIPLPLWLDSAEISVNDADLSYKLSMYEIGSKRDCDFQQEFCTQHWRINVSPNKCTLDGIYTAVMHGECHPGAGNCIEPNPDNTTIEMTITSDDFCGHTQQVDIAGTLELYATECNELLHGTVQVSNPDGAAINRTDIIEVRTSPTLAAPQFMTVYDADSSVLELDYSATMTHPDQVDFSFRWVGAALRCDVVAEVELLVRVEFQATRPLLLSVGPSGSRLLQADEENVHMSATAAISPGDPTSSVGENSSGAETGGIATAFSPVVIGVIAALASLIVVGITIGVIVVCRMKANASSAQPAGFAAVNMA